MGSPRHPNGVSNLWVWSIVATPIIGAFVGNCIDIFLNRENAFYNMIWLSTILYFILVWRDITSIKMADRTVGRIGMWFVLPPLYLYLRNKRLGVSQITTWAWFLTLICSGLVDFLMVQDL